MKSMRGIPAEPHDQISPTAWRVAYCRTFSDIPFSQEIFDALLDVRGQTKDELFGEIEVNVLLALQFEARHKVMNKLIVESGAKQILELASGLTARGLMMTASPDIRYVETDLPGIIDEKRKVIELLTERKIIRARPNLKLEPANALDLASLQRATRHFGKKPIAVVNEGLLRYLNFAEKEAVAKNIRRLLENFGGVWITPDIGNRRIFAEERGETGIDKIAVLTGRDIDNNRFQDAEEAQRFFERLGFSVERHSLQEAADQIASPARLNVSKGRVEEILTRIVVLVMRVAGL
jgi:O-methyltransferase involved in polyketide biosynthesis